MIDLRSDTLTIPSVEMMQFAFRATVGDAGRTNDFGRSCDPSVNQLEDTACELTGKEAAAYMPSGTMGNHVALLTHCKPGETVLLDPLQHNYRIEKVAYDSKFGQLRPTFYKLESNGLPNIESISLMLKKEKPRLLCIENTHNGAGGTVLPAECLKEIRALAEEYCVPIHMDGARIFNASVASGVPVNKICSHVDSVMFCVSKGLGAPMGSLLCGSKEFVERALETRKLLGGNLRQAGYMAAAAEFALRNNLSQLAEDHRRARRLYSLLKSIPVLDLPVEPQTNIIIINVAKTGLSAEEFVNELKMCGVWMSTSGDYVRALLYRGISDTAVEETFNVVSKFIQKRIK